MQRLATLRKHHADEQFLARRNVRDLPDAIARINQRLTGLMHDIGVIELHENDPITIGDRTPARDDLIAVLGRKLDALPEQVSEMTRFALGRSRGLAFGLIKHRYGAPQVYLEGAATRTAQLSRDSHGPRAILNALDRLFNGYGMRCDETRKDLAVAECQLRDYEARLGIPFAHEAYITELSALRDQLKLNLTASTSEPDTKPAVPTHELCDRIKLLKNSHTIEAAPTKRHGTDARMAERPVTARIREKVGQDTGPNRVLPPDAMPETHSHGAIEKIALHATQKGLDEESGATLPDRSALTTHQHGGSAMARKASKAAGIEQEPAAASPAERTGTPSAADASPSAERQAPDAEKRFAPDPFPLTTKNLDGYRLRLQQSRRFNQMQIKFGEGKLDDKPAQELIDFVKAPDGEDGPKFHWNNTDRAWGMRIDMNNPKTSREIAERVFDQVVERLRVEHGAALAR